MKDYRDGGRHAAGRELNSSGWGQAKFNGGGGGKNAGGNGLGGGGGNNNSPIRLNSLSNNKLQSTPLARYGANTD